jgi:hypothetical protein
MNKFWLGGVGMGEEGRGACVKFGGVVFVNLFLLLFLVSCTLQQKCVKAIEGLANDVVYHFF